MKRFHGKQQPMQSHLTLVLRSVINLITLAPQFWARVRGMTSSAFPIAAYGHLEIPETDDSSS